MKVEIQEKLKQLRKARGLTQVEAADMAGVSEQAYNRWERGHTVPTWASLLKLSAAFGVPLEELTSSAPLRGPQPRGVISLADMLRIPVVSRELTACCGDGIPSAEITNDAEEFVYAPRSDFRAFDDLRQPFAIYADGDCLTSDEIHPNDKIVINPAEEAQNGVIVLASLNGVLMLKRFYRLKNGVVALCSDAGELKLTPEQQETSDFYVVGVMTSQIRGRRPARPYVSRPDESRA